MRRSTTLNRLSAVCLLITTMNSLVLGEGLAAIAVAQDRQQAAVTGESAAEGISHETRPRLESRIGNSVDAGTGAFIMEMAVASLQGGRTLDFNLVYNSLLTQTAGPMGLGWSHNYEAFIDGDPSGIVTVHWDQNRKNSFRFVSSNAFYSPEDEAVTYDRLLRRSDGTWKLTRLDGSAFEFAATGELTRVENKVGQSLDLNYFDGRLAFVREPIADRRIDLFYNPDGFIESINDSLNFEERRIYHFTYDSNARLTAVRNPVTLGSEYGTCCPNLTIPDNSSAGLEFVVNVSRSEPIGLIQITVGDIDHSRPQDLRVTLTSPRGTELVLQNGGPGGAGGIDFGRRVLAAFEGENPRGDWRVRVVDSTAGNTGQLSGWAMRFSRITDPLHFSYDGASGRIARATDPDGEQIFANVYDGQGRVIEQDDGVSTNLAARLQYEEFNNGGVRTTYWNRLGDPTVLEHDSRYRLTSVTDPLGNRSSWNYNANGDRIRATDALGRNRLFNYDDEGNLITTVDSAGFVSVFQYVDTNVTRIRDALGKETQFTYDPNNNLTRIRDALGNEDNRTFTGNSQMTGNLLAGRGGIGFTYSNGMPARASHPAESGQVGMEYDALGRLVRILDLEGFATNISYSPTDQIVEQTDHLGNTVTSEYDRRDRLVRKTDGRGNVSRFEYDLNNNLIRMIDARGVATRYEYDGEDRLVNTIDPDGQVSSVAYDAAGRVIVETDPLGNSVRHVYDAAGNETTSYDGRGIKIREVEYDERNFPVLTRDAYGHTISAQYDAVGRLTETRDPLGRIHRFEYDALDRPIRVRDPLGRVSSKEYWPDDFVQYFVDALNHRTEFTYDPARRLERVRTSTGKLTRLTYNRRDLLTQVIKPSGVAYDYTYDEVGRVTRFFSTGSGLIVPDLHYEYDKNGNLITVSRKAFSDITPVPRLRRTYDELNRLRSYTDGQDNRIDYLYDPAGNFSTLVYPDGRQVLYAYDAANRLTTITDWAGRKTHYRYNANSQLTRVEFPNGTIRRIEYDANGRVSLREDLQADGELIVGYGYSYDAAGDVAVETLGHPSPPYAPQPVSMTYDSDNRLQTFNGQATSFDDDGNLTRGPLGPGLSFREFDYDHRGNLLFAGDVTYLYDEEDRLTAFSVDQQRTELVVSPSGDLSQVIQKRDPDGEVTQFVYGVGLAYEVSGSQVRVYHYDQRGSTTAFTDTGGNVVGRVAYGPFGEVIERTGETDSLFLYNGLFGVVTDPNGLNYMRYRWYSPEIRRFVNADAHYGDIALPHTLNRYVYTGNNPINRIDPGGEFWNLVGGALIGGLVSVAIKVASDAISGKPVDFSSGDYWAEVGGAFVGGAVTGACIGSGVGIAAGAACGAAGSSLGYLTTTGLKGDQVDPGQLAFEAGIGAASGALTAGAGRFLRFGGRGTALGNRFRQFRQGFAADDPTAFKLGLLARDKVILGSDEYLVANILAKAGARKLIGTSAGKEVGKALARRAFTPTFGALVGGNLAVKIGGRVASNVLFNSQSGGAAGSGEDNPDIEDEGRTAVSRAIKGQYGEFIHWQLYINSLMQAGRPIPDNPNNVLATF